MVLVWAILLIADAISKRGVTLVTFGYYMTALKNQYLPAYDLDIRTGVQTNLGTFPALLQDLTKPKTSKRPKPIDLFASTTSRTVVEETQQWTYGSRSTASTTRVGPVSIFDSTMALGTPGPTVDDYADLDAKVRLKIKDQTVNLGNAIAEYEQTAEMFTSIAKDIYQTYRSLRSGRAVSDFVKNVSRPSSRNGKALADRWLQYQFGLKPTLSDMYGSCEALRKTLSNGMVCYATATGHTTTQKTTPRPYGVITTSVELHRKVKARYRISSSTLQTLASVGITNPASVIWEIIPWSFVIDWMLPVGDWLNGLDALLGVSNVYVARSYRMVETSDYPFVNTGNIVGVGNVTSISGYATGKRVTTCRFDISPTLSIGHPSFKNPFTKAHIANGLALLRQMKF